MCKVTTGRPLEDDGRRHHRPDDVSGPSTVSALDRVPAIVRRGHFPVVTGPVRDTTRPRVSHAYSVSVWMRSHLPAGEWCHSQSSPCAAWTGARFPSDLSQKRHKVALSGTTACTHRTTVAPDELRSMRPYITRYASIWSSERATRDRFGRPNGSLWRAGSGRRRFWLGGSPVATRPEYSP